MGKIGSGCLLAALLVLGRTDAAAQDAPPRHEATAELAFVGVSGNASSSTFGAGFETIHRPDSWLLRHRFAFVRNESDGDLTAQSLLYRPRIEKSLHPRLSAFGDYEFFRDRFAGVSQRHSANLGLAVKLVAREAQTLGVDGGLGFFGESRLTGESLSSGAWSAGTSYRLKISDSADLSDDAAIVGVFEEGAGWRFRHTIALTARLTQAFSLKVSNDLRYSSAPVTGFKKTDTVTSIALVARLASAP